MSMRRQARTFVAVAAAYAVALQAIMLALGGPIAGAGVTEARPICSAVSPGQPAPVNDGTRCLGACLGCCCAPQGCSRPASMRDYGPALADSPAVTAVTTLRVVARASNANRSRAPPRA